MKHVCSIGHNFAPGAYEGTTPPRLELATHDFYITDDGCLGHMIDGKPRAIVPPGGFDGYEALWPDCAPVLKELRGAEGSAKVTRAPVSKAKGKKGRR